MRTAKEAETITLIGLSILLCLVLFGVRVKQTWAEQDQEAEDFYVYLPVLIKPICSTSSANQYSSGTAYQFDLDNPVRPAYLHADKNLALRGYLLNTDSSLRRELIDLGSDDPNQPPQLATIFTPWRVPSFAGFYRVHHWNWASSPDPGSRGSIITNPAVTALGLQTKPGEPLHVPSSGYDIGGGMEVLVLYADEDSVTLRYAREDSAGSPGYTLHIDKLCTNPNLLALYNALDAPSGPRYRYVPPGSRPYGYPLPNLPAGMPIGTAMGTEVFVAVVDSGAFQDPRSCNEWWQIRPGYGPCNR